MIESPKRNQTTRAAQSRADGVFCFVPVFLLNALAVAAFAIPIAATC